MKIIDAVCVTSEYKKRQQIQFDEQTGLIVSVGDNLTNTPDYYYGDDCLLFAGMGDIHIHAREDLSGKNTYKEDFLSARAAMINGGVTHAGDMPNNPIPPVDKKSYEDKLHLSEKACGDLWLYAGIGPATLPLPYKVPYKVYMGPSIGELFFKDLKSLDETLKNYQGEWVSFHCEDPEILEEHKTESHHYLRRPVKAEAVATKDALSLIEKYQLNGKLCHYSSQEGLELIREARKKGVNVLLEVTPQHLFFDMEHLSTDKLNEMQMNPPIRSEIDRLALIEALKNGEIQFLATDHAPHSEDEKKKGTSGLTGLDTYGPFVTWLLTQGLDAKLIASVASENPGKFFNTFLPSWKSISSIYSGFGKGLGFLKEDYRANFTILNLNKPFKVERFNLKTKVKNNPFIGHTFPGQIEALFIGGQKV